MERGGEKGRGERARGEELGKEWGERRRRGGGG